MAKVPDILAQNSTYFQQTTQASNASGQGLFFPGELASYPFWMSMSFYEYRAPGFNEQTILADNGTIRLPLPNAMADHQGVQYSVEKAGLVAGMALQAMNQSGGDLSALAGGAKNGLLNSAAINTINKTGNLAGVQNASNLILQQLGAAVNPFLTVMFQQPKFKTFSLSWKLSPANATESSTLVSIINTIKYNMLPGKSGAFGGSLLTYPNIIQLRVNDALGSMPLRFLPAVIETFDVNYTPSGQPSFFADTNAPTEVEIRMGIMEIEYWLKESYGAQGPDNALKLQDKITSTFNSLSFIQSAM